MLREDNDFFEIACSEEVQTPSGTTSPEDEFITFTLTQEEASE